MSTLSMPIIILAAGESRRMRGRDKLLEAIDGVPLLRHQAMKAREATNGPVLVALPPAPHRRYEVLDGLGVIIVPVSDAAEGMNASLRSAFAALPDYSPCAMVLLGDLPDITCADLIKVGNAVDLKASKLIWRGATSDGAAGHPIVFHANLFNKITQLSGDSGGREVVKSAGDAVALIPLKGSRARMDLDTPEAWDAWRAANKTI